MLCKSSYCYWLDYTMCLNIKRVYRFISIFFPLFKYLILIYIYDNRKNKNTKRPPTKPLESPRKSKSHSCLISSFPYLTKQIRSDDESKIKEVISYYILKNHEQKYEVAPVSLSVKTNVDSQQHSHNHSPIKSDSRPNTRKTSNSYY